VKPLAEFAEVISSEAVTEGASEWRAWHGEGTPEPPAGREGGLIGPAKRSLPCECGPGRRDPHRGGWCRYCGRVLPKKGV